jgi:DNA-binding GntR family transcriptional regulator
VNKQERTYTILRDRIHTGEYQPLDRLNIDALAREFGVSQIPVREALRRLEAEGWVQFRPNAGAVVAPVDTTSWEQAMVALAVLEGAATADAWKRLRKADIARLRRITGQMERALDDPLKFATLNRQFHDVIVERSTNEVLRDLLVQTHRRLDQVRRTMFVYLPERSKAAVGEHLHLVGLLENGDAEQVESYARWHKLQTVEAYRAIHRRA